MASKKETDGGALGLVSSLIEIGRADTVYRDVYLDRARALLEGELTLEDFRRLEQQQSDLAELPLQIGRAVERANWPRVKELSGHAQALRQSVEGKRRLFAAAREVYTVTEIRLDPFSPGLQSFVRLPTRDRSALRARAVEQLTQLEKTDAEWRTFYAGRRAAFESLVLATSKQSAITDQEADPQQAAAEALERGDMRSLEKLAAALMTAGAKGPAAHAPAPSSAIVPEPAATDLLAPYSADTIERARRLGLGSRRLESQARMAFLRQYAWHPLSADRSGRIRAQEVPLPAGTPEGFRERLEMLMIHPLVNSGGARHLPKLVAEDVLIEDFPDPAESEQPPQTPLLAALGLASRRGLPRIAIEQALLAHGGRVVDEELALDSRAYRLVCIPSDVHLRLGLAEGWGRQPLWTHFDGYLVMPDGRLRALAGGDARFGGLHDLLGLSRDYDTDRVVARFAVVRRERMAAW